MVGTFGISVLSTTFIEKPHLGSGFHCTPTHGVSTTPGAGFFFEVQSSCPARASMFTLNSASATAFLSCGSPAATSAA